MAGTPSPKSVAEGREKPRTSRGLRTRALLVTAARTVFERDGYLDARLRDITEEAGTAAGSFYTYFSSKEEIFAAVLEDVQEEMLHPHVRAMADTDDPVAVIEASNRAYLSAYRRNAALMALLEQVSTIDEYFRDVRKRRVQAFARRNAESVADLQRRGLVDPELDPELATAALSAMVSRTAYTAYVLGEEYDFEHLVSTLTRLWVNALRIPTATTA
ncbi:TetR/AcrR family transcriptional regulator [Streptomyces sp. NPDC001928]|uniref:TetR/AcrR family transcriptional regulator n=1 Tax=Streptomyces sp. NPDC001928 TaxID=3154404 RepID=UPI00332D68F7